MHTCKCAFWSCVFVTFVALSVNTSDSFSVRSILASIFYDSKKVANGLKDLRFRHYTGFPLQELGDRSFSLDQTSDVLESIDQQKPFVLYIHGYEEHPSNESVQTIVTAYLQRASDNIVVLDWSAVAFGNYVGVALSTEDVSKYTAEALGKLVSAGLNVNTLHVIGHSLGGQIAGFLGRYLNFVIPRVTGILHDVIIFFIRQIAEYIREKCCCRSGPGEPVVLSIRLRAHKQEQRQTGRCSTHGRRILRGPAEHRQRRLFRQRWIQASAGLSYFRRI
ncbi:unnamed protein product [Trichogramma brassicae]|uniref:phospholipase A1 n=1 Tax=Trichogramma brassicae TaxID=86971 RepID=A0A6H5IJ59_9HYME|nr:unnamed protein product [Trichogramma brassicae]